MHARFNTHTMARGELNTVEVYMDFVCPFSRKMYAMLTEHVVPKWNESHAIDKRIQFVFKHQIQPWHIQSMVVHEVSLAAELNGANFMRVASALFANYERMVDTETWNKSRHQLYDELCRYLSHQVDVDYQKMMDTLMYNNVNEGAAKNNGNLVTDLLKYHIKLARQLSVHVSPSVYINELYASEAQSSFTYE